MTVCWQIILHKLKNILRICRKCYYIEVTNWKKSLEEDGVISLKNIGELRLNSESNIIFTPNDQTNYLSTSFGLSPFVSPMVKKSFSRKIEKIAAKEKEVVLLDDNEEPTKSSNSFLRYLCYFGFRTWNFRKYRISFVSKSN